MDDGRERLWISLSDLWLDTETTEASLRSMAEVVRESGLSRIEVEELLRHELAPFLDANLKSVAGEWAGFDPNWVRTRARALHEQRRSGERVKPARARGGKRARKEWTRVLDLAFAPADPSTTREEDAREP